ncbi:MAG TPA: vWA domain-containing protein, partial [Polyangiaceae bacterium]|nr:vWA domain-containing protein [Polyangiaceae bacterium]
MSPAMSAAMPWVAAGALALATLVYFRLAWDRLKKRKLLFLGVVLSLLPATLAVLVWLRVLPEAYVRLVRPMLAPVAAVAMAAVAARLAGEDVSRKSRVRTFLSDFFVTATLLALAAVVMGIEIGRPLDRLSVIVVIDRSRSIDLVPDAEDRVTREIAAAEAGMREDDLIATVAFGANAVTEEPARPKDRHAAAQKALVAKDGTDIDAAIRRALAEVPPDSAARIVVLSDGVVTRGDVMGAAAAALAAEVPVDVLPLEQRAVEDVRVVAVRAPARGDAGEPIDLRVVTSSPKETEVELRILRDGELIKKGNVKIAAGEDVVRVREKLPEAGLHRYDVEVTALDKSLDFSGEDNAGSTFVRVRGEASVLVLEGEHGKGAFIADVLRQASFKVDEADAAGVPADLGAFAPYDLVILSDIPASALAPSQIDAMAS